MTPPLFLLEAIPPDGDSLVLGGDEGHHAARVRRVTVGETVLVGDGRGTLLTCAVAEVTGGEVRLRVLDRAVAPLPAPRLVVVQALPKGERAELAVETMTELGVDVAVPWAASRSVTVWHGARGDKSLARWQRTAREAAKQSRRSRYPEITALASTADVAERLRLAARALVLHEAAAQPLATVPLPSVGDVVIVVGPEGGISPQELATFADATPVLLGEPVLRTSTAGAAALAALSVRLGRWG